MGAPLLRNRSRRATFLCYHSVAPEGPTYLTVTAELFERQLAELKREGIRGGDLAALQATANGDEIAPTAFLTFDDGFRDSHGTVLPLLREYGFPAFVFILPPLVDSAGPLAWPEVAADQQRFPATMRSIDWEMAGEMKEGGFEVGAHTLTHPHLPELGPEALREELWESRARVKERLGTCDTLAYPFGEWSPEVAAAAAECGYSFAFSLPHHSGQRAAGPHSIPRINVDYRDDEQRFSRKISPLGKRLFLSPEFALARRLTRRLRGRPAPGTV